MFTNENKLKKAFKAVKKDFVALKDSANEWILFLNASNRELKQRVRDLEKRLDRLELQRIEDLTESKRERVIPQMKIY